MAEAVWLETDSDDETLEETRARGGWLSPAGRKAAIGSALAVVGRYFQSGGTVRRQGGLDLTEESPESDTRLLVALRFRQSLTLASQLITLLERILHRPTFRYSLAESESVGQVLGTLDIGRYISTRQPIVSGPPTYPILEVRRIGETPENTLAAYAALWMIRQLQTTQRGSGAPMKAPESILANQLVDRLSVLLGQPALQAASSAAADTLRRTTEERLFARVAERIRRREIAAPDPYEALLKLMKELHSRGPSGVPGMEPWSFYDDSFDRRLFELWCLHHLGQSISEALAVDPPVYKADSSGLAYRWERPAGVIEIYYQRSVSTVCPDRQSLWRRDEGTIGGIPDYVVRASIRESGEVRLAILDAKLRQRSGVPTEELYKILGYFENYGIKEAQRGGILSYDPRLSEPLVYNYYNQESKGHLLATVANPADEAQSSASFKPVAAMVLSLLQIPPSDSSVPPSDELEEIEESVIRQRLSELKAVTVHLAPQTLEASARRLKALLGEVRWNRLDADARSMLATAEHVGFLLGQDADYSGPVLGLVAPMEKLLDQRITQVVRELSPGERGLDRLTLGALLDVLEKSLRMGSHRLVPLVTQAISQSGAPTDDLLSIVLNLQQINRDFRRPAAHKENLSHEQWHEAYRRLLSEDRLLHQLIDVLFHGRSTEAVQSGDQA